MDERGIRELLQAQDGVAARRQLLAAGASDADLARLVRRRELVRLRPGVYVDHTGAPSPTQRLWAGVLAHTQAVLTGASALAAYAIPVDTACQPRWIEVAVAAWRRVDDPPGISTVRLRDFERVARFDLSPPRVSIEHAALTVAARAPTDDAAVAVLAAALDRTRAAALRDEALLRRRLPRRALLVDLLADVDAGARSPLEHRYLTRVERPHGLPTAARQREVRRGRTLAFRDVDYLGLRTVVELDGRLGHDALRHRWSDLDRDVASLLQGDLTVRLGWRHVLDPCRTAAAVGQVLRTRGWAGRPRACGPRCPARPT